MLLKLVRDNKFLSHKNNIDGLHNTTWEWRHINTMNIIIVNSIVIQCLFKQLGYWNKYAINMHSSEYSHR